MCSLRYRVHRFDGDSATVAKLLANSGFKSAYAIKGGAEGPNGWNVRIAKPLSLPAFLLETNLEANVFI